MAMACSATLTVFAVGVLATRIPRSEQALMSICCGEGFSKLFCAHVVAVNNVRIGNSWRELDQQGFEYFGGDWRH
jgi:hypothetical protein